MRIIVCFAHSHMKLIKDKKKAFDFKRLCKFGVAYKMIGRKKFNNASI